jgi:hypothetical protein
VKIHCLKQINSGEIPNLIERSQFNKRRRKLFFFSRRNKNQISFKIFEFEDYFIVDSMPLEICKFSRHSRIKICKDEFETLLQKVFVPHKTIGFMDINFMEFVL